MNHREDYHNETYWKRIGALMMIGCATFTIYCFAAAYFALTGTLTWVGFWR